MAQSFRFIEVRVGCMRHSAQTRQRHSMKLRNIAINLNLIRKFARQFVRLQSVQWEWDVAQGTIFRFQLNATRQLQTYCIISLPFAAKQWENQRERFRICQTKWIGAISSGCWNASILRSTFWTMMLIPVRCRRQRASRWKIFFW